MIRKSYKYRIYPNNKQKVLIEKHFDCCRFMYNWGLEQKLKAYEKDKKHLSWADLGKMQPTPKTLPWLEGVLVQSLQASLLNLDNAFTRFFRKKANFPRFKSKKISKHTYSYQQGTKIDFKNNRIWIPKIKYVKAKISRSFEGKIKTSTVYRTRTNKYFISFILEQEEEFPKKPKIQDKTTLGIDLGIENFLTLSNGQKVSNFNFLKRSLGKLKILNQRLSKKKKGSKNRDKARLRVARLYEKITNQRNDFLHKLTHKLTHENQVDSIALETLDVENMKQTRYLARSINDAAWSTFVSFLTYKADWYGKNILRIGQFKPSSQICSNCGSRNKELQLVDRIWTCSTCHSVHDRDINAAINIKKFALQKQNLVYTGLEQPGELAENSGCKTDSMKQEILC